MDVSAVVIWLLFAAGILYVGLDNYRRAQRARRRAEDELAGARKSRPKEDVGKQVAVLVGLLIATGVGVWISLIAFRTQLAVNASVLALSFISTLGVFILSYVSKESKDRTSPQEVVLFLWYGLTYGVYPNVVQAARAGLSGGS